MPDAATTAPDPVALVDSLDPDAIRAELDQLYGREAALRVLLRSAEARRRREARAARKEVAHGAA
jgi:hypothetical protein